MAEDDKGMNIAEQTEKIADSRLLLAVARISMALSVPVVVFITTLGAMYLDQKFANQDIKIDGQRTSIESKLEQQKNASELETRTHVSRIERVEKTAEAAIASSSRINDRLISVETKQVQDSQAAAQFQRDTLNRLDRMQDSLITLSNAIAALTATLQAQAEGSTKPRAQSFQSLEEIKRP